MYPLREGGDKPRISEKEEQRKPRLGKINDICDENLALTFERYQDFITCPARNTLAVKSLIINCNS